MKIVQRKWFFWPFLKLVVHGHYISKIFGKIQFFIIFYVRSFSNLLLILFRNFKSFVIEVAYTMIHGRWYLRYLRKTRRRIVQKICSLPRAAMFFRSILFYGLQNCRFSEKMVLFTITFQMEYPVNCIIFRSIIVREYFFS